MEIIHSTTPTTRTQPLSKLTDRELLDQCHHYGSQAKLWKQRFLGLLPEVERRKLYEQQGCSSVFEFAAKLGGMSREQVLLTFRLDKRFETAPVVKEALLSGSVPMSKLARVASVVTSENQEFWLTQSKLLSKDALETLVRDAKAVPEHASNPNKIHTVVNGGLKKVSQTDELQLNPEIKQRLLALQNKGLDVNQILGELLDKREERIQEEKKEVGRELEPLDNTSAKQTTTMISPKKSRYIPVKIKKIITQEYGSKCAQDQCLNQATNIHHTRRFALNSSHNPLYLAPLCKQHHEIAHSIDVRSIHHRQIAS